MIEIKGKCNKDCKIYADTIEDEAIKMIYSICDSKVFEGQKIRIMPDVHVGKGITIGFSSTMDKDNPVVNPSHVGVDIGCTVSMFNMTKALDEDSIEYGNAYSLFEHKVRRAIPMGFDINTYSFVDEKEFFKLVRSHISAACIAVPKLAEYLSANFDERDLDKMLNRIGMDNSIFWRSLGTLGGGNHYLEYGKSEKDNTGWISVHCGSRNFGVKVANYWIKKAERPTKIDKDVWKVEVEKIKKTCTNKREIKDKLKTRKVEILDSKPIGYLINEDAYGYLADMVIAQAYAMFNHKTIIEKIERIYKDIVGECEMRDLIVTTHNYIDFNDFIIRKGAVYAGLGQKLAIPMNMRDGVLICVGKGNDDWNCTAPHGAGRLMSRSKAKDSLTMGEYKKSMEGIITTSVEFNTLDESPMAYKPMEEIMRLIEPTVEIVDIIKPKINWKAAE